MVVVSRYYCRVCLGRGSQPLGSVFERVALYGFVFVSAVAEQRVVYPPVCGVDSVYFQASPNRCCF